MTSVEHGRRHSPGWRWIRFQYEWGGWEDLETFLNRYKGTYSPAAQRQAREKVSWL